MLSIYKVTHIARYNVTIAGLTAHPVIRHLLLLIAKVVAHFLYLVIKEIETNFLFEFYVFFRNIQL